MATGNRREVSLNVRLGATVDPSIEAARKEVLDLAAASAKAARDAQAAAKSQVDAERAALNQKKDALARIRIENEAGLRSEADAVEAIRAARTAVLDQTIALRQKSEAVAKAAAATKTAVAAEKAAQRDLDSLRASYQAVGSAATAAGEAQAVANRKASASVSELNAMLGQLRNIAGLALGGSLIGGLAKSVGETADEFAGLQSRIKLVTGEGAAFNAVFEGVLQIAQRTGTGLNDVGSLFAKLAQAGKALNLTNAQALALTESITQATQLSGASAEASTAAIVQFSQAIASGVLRGDELNSILEQAPRLARALADGLGVTTGELRKMGEAGALTATQVIGALQGQSAALQREFSQLTPTIGRAITGFSNNWLEYVGNADKATGASATAAKAITALGNNLDTLGALLGAAGKAAAALVAINLSKVFFDKAAAINLAAASIGKETAAVATNTAAVVANTAAQRANVAATAAVAVENSAAALTIGSRVTQISAAVSGVIGAVSRLAGIAAGVGAVVAVVSLLGDAFKGAGTFIGETAAKMLGAKDRSEELAIALKGDAEAARLSAQQNAQLAQSLQIAAEKSLGLTDQSRKLIAEFTDTITKGGEVSVALEKISKALELGNLDGIRNAGVALDVLGQRGTLSGAQIRDALAAGLSSADLGIFAVNARAAFDSSEQGARRLQAALDAIANESLRRAGSSVDELKTGFSKAMNSAINDVDTLGASLLQLGAKGADSNRLLGASLNKALDTATTERAVNAVIERFQALGKQGQISGDQLAAGMEKARQKIDALLPGVQGLDEALKNFGLQTQGELQATADKMTASWQQVSQAVGVSLVDQRRAFDQYAQAVTAANNGIEPSAVAVTRAILETRDAAASTGAGIENAMRRSGDAVDALAAKFDRLNGVARNAGNVGGNFNDRVTQSGLDSQKRSDDINSVAADNSGADLLMEKIRKGQVTEADRALVEGALAAAKVNDRFSRGNANVSLEGQREDAARLRAFSSALEKLNSPVSGNAANGGGGTSHTVKIQIGGKATTINAASADDAVSLASLLQQLGSASATSA